MSIERLKPKTGWVSLAVLLTLGLTSVCLAAPVPGGTLDPTSIPKYVRPLIIPPAMPRTGVIVRPGDKKIDYYEIAVRQFQQEIVPGKMTTVWSYGSVNAPGTVDQGGSFNYPAFTIEAKWRTPVRVKWINDLSPTGPHLLPVDQTLHWANPPGLPDRDSRGSDPTSYTGAVPIITHVHGAHTHEESDGYPEAWYLPAGASQPYTVGTKYDEFKAKFLANYGESWQPGTATFQYDNDQRATTLWYHDHTLGMTRLNVYAGPAGFYLLRGGPDDEVLDSKNSQPATLPGPAPALGDRRGMDYYEIPIVIQDRSFNADGSLFYPDNRAFFEGLDPADLDIPFIPDIACGDYSDVSPIWQPEFFGNTMVVNGRTWPYLKVEPRRYRLRLLNGCNSRFLILKLDAGLSFTQIGADGGFLPAPVTQGDLLLGPAERADVIVDFSSQAVGRKVILRNVGPDEPFGGGTPDVDFDASDAGTTGQVMQFEVVAPRRRGSAVRGGPRGQSHTSVGPGSHAPDDSTPVERLVLPTITRLGPSSLTRDITLNEEESSSVFVSEVGGKIVLDCDDGAPFGPTSALLGTMGAGPLLWMDPVTENPATGATETWAIHNFTEDAHPIHIHLVQFEILGRDGRGPEPGETGFKDTVIAYPGEVTRVKARFDYPGLFVWHCHIIEHEDNEMMRPYRVGP